MGETVARILDRSVEHASGGETAADYLREAAQAFRGEDWMNLELTRPELAVAEENSDRPLSRAGGAGRSP